MYLACIKTPFESSSFNFLL
uniref:Uncharacterized protein n=1 Tax=Anguilla anguilla TaxID=7936 RepID=A0A0E9V4D9_ANGAN